MIIDLDRFDAFAFDLDGVVTKTAAVHAAAWKRLFDEVLERRAAGNAWEPFDDDREYRMYVDGKPRRDGLTSFLESRDIHVPDGSPGDGPDADTAFGLAARKNGYVLERLARDGVEAYAGAVALIRRARAHGKRTAIVSASENCAAVLAAAGLSDLFDAKVDGVDSARLGLRGKPAPDTFLAAARQLGADPGRTVVFEDAIAGVAAGRAGQFGLVIGVDRKNHAAELRRAGADDVVTALDNIELTRAGVGVEQRP